MSIEQLPSGSWRVTVVVGGEKHRTTVRGTRREAQQVEAELRAEAGRNPTKSDATVADLLVRHLEDHPYAPTTLADLKSVSARLPSGFVEMKVRNVKPSDVDALYRRLTAEGWSPWRVRKAHELLGSAWGLARRWGWTNLNPIRDSRPPKLPTREIDPPDSEQVRALLVAAGDEFGLALRILAVTGMRRGELCGLRWEDVEFDTGNLAVKRGVSYVAGQGLIVGEGKTGRKGHRRVQLDPVTFDRLVALARVQCRSAGFIFSRDGGVSPWRPDFVTSRFGALRDRLGLRGVRLHDIRHFVATSMMADGVDVTTIAGVLGHANPTTTLRVYSHFLPARGAEAVAQVAAGLGE